MPSLAADYRIFALIVENTFTGIPDMAHTMFAGARYIPLICFKNRVCVCTCFVCGMGVCVVVGARMCVCVCVHMWM